MTPVQEPLYFSRCGGAKTMCSSVITIFTVSINFGRSAIKRLATGLDVNAAVASSTVSNHVSAIPSHPMSPGSGMMFTTYPRSLGIDLAMSACGPSQWDLNSSAVKPGSRLARLSLFIMAIVM